MLHCPSLEFDDTTADLLGLEQGLAVAELSHSQVQAQEACPPLKRGLLLNAKSLRAPDNWETSQIRSFAGIAKFC